MSVIVDPRTAGLVAPGNSEHLVKTLDNARRGLAEVAPGVVVPTEGWLCRAHGRHCQKRKIKAGDVHRALIDALLDNARFRKRCGGIAGAAALTAQLLAVRPWCCYLSAPERKAAFAFAQREDLDAELLKRMAERKDRAAAGAERREIDRLSAQHGVPLTDAAYAFHALYHDAALASAALEQAQREGAAAKDVVDAIRAAL